MIYFTSDTHFCHSNIINLTNRPFKDVKEMNTTLIRNWNSCVADNDEIYILGDLIYKGTADEANAILERLNGKKYLIRGNHDKFLDDENFNNSIFEWVKDYYVLNYKKTKFVLFHYPILEWDGFFKGDIHLYGHVHNAGKGYDQNNRLSVLGKHSMNVGVDVNKFFPVSIESIIRKCK